MPAAGRVGGARSGLAGGGDPSPEPGEDLSAERWHDAPLLTRQEGDLKSLGEVLDNGQAGLIVVYATNMADQIAANGADFDDPPRGLLERRLPARSHPR